ncbi:MAG: phosphoribosylanthranilate isomerase [Sumerlaeia bacterium]
MCGLTLAEDALLALELGASFLGLIFAEGTPRCLTLEDARALLGEVRARSARPVRPFGVFVHEPVGRMVTIVRELDLAAVQLHGEAHADEALSALPVPAIRAVRVKGPESAAEIEPILSARGVVLLDTYAKGQHGGTGKTFDHDVARPFFGRGRVFLAGGLTPDNIGAVAGELGPELPYAFDVSSGLEEAPRRKSAEKMRRFFGALEAAGVLAKEMT